MIIASELIIASEFIHYSAELYSAGHRFGLYLGLIVWFMAYCAVQVIHFFKTITNG